MNRSCTWEEEWASPATLQHTSGATAAISIQYSGITESWNHIQAIALIFLLIRQSSSLNGIQQARSSVTWLSMPPIPPFRFPKSITICTGILTLPVGLKATNRPFPEMAEKDKEDARKVYAMVSNIDDNICRVLEETR